MNRHIYTQNIYARNHQLHALWESTEALLLGVRKVVDSWCLSCLGPEASTVHHGMITAQQVHTKQPAQ